jgi:voltage-gated sodium channel
MTKISQLLLNDKFVLGLIIFNSTIIFLQGFDLPQLLHTILEHIDNSVSLIFLIEIIVKWKEYGVRKYFKSNWNIFDASLVFLALPSLFFWFVEASASQLDFLLVLRISRVFKFFRFIKFFPNINHLIVGLQRALKASVIILIGFFVYIFLVSILSCFFYRTVVPELFGNPIISFYSIFKIFTVEGWYEIPDEIANHTSTFIGGITKLYFVVIVFTGGIFGLSIVNSIFVDAMVSDNNDELEKKIDNLEQKIDQLLKDNTSSKIK